MGDSGGATEASASESARLFGPCLDVGPVPCWTTSDRPAGRGQKAALHPLVDGRSLHAEAFRDLLEADGIGGWWHVEVSITGVLTSATDCRDNHHMTNPRFSVLRRVSDDTIAKGLDFYTAQVEAGHLANVNLLRAFLAEAERRTTL